MENVIEFYTGDSIACGTFTQGRYKTKIRKLAETHPDEVFITENKDGSIYAKFPTAYLKISPKKKVSEKQKEQARMRLKKYQEDKRNGNQNS